jgi:dTDP-4-dehydrorhamnose 3,5-epimerase
MSTISGVRLIEFTTAANDDRGTLHKIFNESQLSNFKLSEVIRSKTNKGFIRGMHLQTGKMASNKVVYCLQGKVFDVMIDLRKNSPSFLQVCTVDLSSSSLFGIFIPIGVAHGFQSLMQDTEILYLIDKKYSKDHDKGINPINNLFSWPLPIKGLSERDKKLPAYRDFIGDSID